MACGSCLRGIDAGFPERPTFYVTAGQRGGGKTTALTMLTLATLGVKPAVMAWTDDAEERRKALYAVLRGRALSGLRQYPLQNRHRLPAHRALETRPKCTKTASWA
jgi:hypothetical protein